MEGVSCWHVRLCTVRNLGALDKLQPLGTTRVWSGIRQGGRALQRWRSCPSIRSNLKVVKMSLPGTTLTTHEFRLLAKSRETVFELRYI